MQYNYYFDICALLILATIALTSWSRGWVPSYRQRVYFGLFLITLLATGSERIETYLQMNPCDAPWYHAAEMLTGSVYFACHLGSGFFYLMYVLAVLDIYVNMRKPKEFMMIGFGYILGMCLVLINIFVPILFYYDNEGIYHRGNLIYAFYLIAGYYIIHGLYIVIRYREQMRLRTLLVVLSYILLVAVGICVQYFLPTVLIENFFGTISITLVFISLHNPSEMVDENLNILNRKAFFEGLDIRTGRKSVHSTVFITIDNIRALSEEIGYSQSQGALKKIAGYLKKVGKKESGVQSYAYRFSENCFAVTLHTDDDSVADKLMDTISHRLDQPWRYGNMAIRVEGHCFKMQYPGDYSNASELMTRLAAIFEKLDLEPDTVVDVRGKKLYESTDVMEYDGIARYSIEAKKAFLKFQPMLSKKYRTSYCVDVVCFGEDEDGNEVNMTGHMLDIRITQSLLDLDEFVIRSACRALCFWNAGDAAGRYKAIVGISLGEISRSDFIRRIKKIIREEKAEASWLGFKLTETSLSTMNSMAEKNLNALAEMKCFIVVDNFGGGFGDFQRLLQIPITQINLDRNMLEKAIYSEDIKKIVKGTVDILHSINNFVAAVDIDTPELVEIANEIGCDYIIGDYLAKPVKDSSFVKYIDAYYDA